MLTNRLVWTYHLEPVERGTRIIESRETPRGIGNFARAFTRVLLGGQVGHDDDLEAGMAKGLERTRDLSLSEVKNVALSLLGRGLTNRDQETEHSNGSKSIR